LRSLLPFLGSDGGYPQFVQQSEVGLDQSLPQHQHLSREIEALSVDEDEGEAFLR
jgi:hypothetical protein